MFGAAIQLAMREIRANMMRSILTALGIIIGVSAVIVMVTLGGGASASVQRDIEGLGRNLLIVVPVAPNVQGPGAGSSPPFDSDDLAGLRREITGVIAIAPSLNRSVTAVYGSENHATAVTGTDNAFFQVREWPVALGRTFSDGELQGGKAVCILGETVREDLFGAQNPLDAKLRLGDISCTVIGVLSAKGQSTMGNDQDDLIVMPIKAVQRRIAGNRDISMMWVSASSPEEVTTVQERITLVMRERRHIAEGQDDDFSIRDLRELARVVESTTSILTAFLGAIAAVSLLVGGIGIMNIMLVSVTERTREIGIRLAVGARERDVLLQFLIEAVILSGFGGTLGILIGLGGSALLAPLLGVPFVFNALIVAIAFVFSGAVGVIFGFFPARRAARLDPIEALRFE
jgi:putative ABC transport system permease protein